MKDQVTLLRDEHRGIVRQLGLVAKSLGALEPGPRRTLRESISELGLRLEAHFAHEEQAIYAPLDSRLKGSSPMGELVKDHRLIREAFRKLDKMGAERAPAAKLSLRLSALRSALDGHLEKEETVVFWLADCRL